MRRARTGAFQTMRFSDTLLQFAGITVVTVDLSEIIAATRARWTAAVQSVR